MAANEVTITRGQFTRDGTSTLLKRFVRDEIYKKSPGKASLMQVMMKCKRIVASNRKVEWIEQDLDPRYVTLGAITPGAGNTATIAMTDADIVTLKAGMSLGFDTTTTIHITAAVYTAGSATITIDDRTGLVAGNVMLIGAGVVQELSPEPTAITRTPALITNNMITVRDAWGQSGWTESDEYYGGRPRQVDQREDAKLQHKISLDVEAWIGNQPGTQLTLSSNNIMYTDGLFAQIQTNRAAVTGGILTYEALTTIAQSFDRLMESDEPWLFVGRAILPILDIVAYQKTVPNNFKDIGKQLGVSVRSLVLGNKDYNLIVVDHWTGPQYGTVMVGLDLKQVNLCCSADRETGKLRWMMEYMRGMDITGIDGTTGCFTSDLCVRLLNEQGAFIITNVISA